MQCPKCGTENSAEKTFCTKCGEFLVELAPSSENKTQERPIQVVDNPDYERLTGEKNWKRWNYLIVGLIEVIMGIGMVAFFYFLFHWIPFLWPLVALFCVLMPATATAAIYLGHYKTAAVLYIVSGIPLILGVAMGLLGFWAAVHALRRSSITRSKRKWEPDQDRVDGFLIKVSPAQKIIVLSLVLMTFVIPLATAGVITAGTHPYVKQVSVPDERRVSQQISVHVYLSNLGFTSAKQEDIKIKFEGDTPKELDWTGGDLEFGKGSLMKTFYTGTYIHSLKVIHKGEVVHEKVLEYRYVSDLYDVPW